MRPGVGHANHMGDRRRADCGLDAITRQQGRSLGEVVSDLARRALRESSRLIVAS